MLQALKEHLQDWTDFDVAEFLLGQLLGIFPEGKPWAGVQEFKHVVWSAHPMGNFLAETLEGLVKLGVLEKDPGGGTTFRWNQKYDILGTKTEDTPETRDREFAEFVVDLPYDTLVERSPTPDKEWLVWLLDVPAGQLCKVEDDVLERAFALWGAASPPFHLLSASEEKSQQLRARTNVILVSHDRTGQGLSEVMLNLKKESDEKD